MTSQSLNRACGVDVLRSFSERAIPVTESGCWLWIGDTGTRRGYGRFRMNGRPTLAHRASWMLHRGSIPDGLCVCHRCDTPSCVNPDHLFLETNEGNTADRVRKHRSRGGNGGAANPVKHSQHHQAKLTDEQVTEIRALAVAGKIPQRSIAARFGISQPNVSAIKNGVTWYEGRRSRWNSQS